MEFPTSFRILKVVLNNLEVECALETFIANEVDDNYMVTCDECINQMPNTQLNEKLKKIINTEFKRLYKVEEMMEKALGKELKNSGLNVAAEISDLEAMAVIVGNSSKYKDTFHNGITEQRAVGYLKFQIRKHDEIKKSFVSKNTQLNKEVENLKIELKNVKTQVDDLIQINCKYSKMRMEEEKMTKEEVSAMKAEILKLKRQMEERVSISENTCHSDEPKLLNKEVRIDDVEREEASIDVSSMPIEETKSSDDMNKQLKEIKLTVDRYEVGRNGDTKMIMEKLSTTLKAVNDLTFRLYGDYNGPNNFN